MSIETAECDRCGRLAEGRRRWMFYRRVTGPQAASEFHCFTCIRRMRLYAAIGFGLLFLVVGGLIAVTLWLTA